MNIKDAKIGTVFKSVRTWQTYLLLEHRDDCCKVLRLKCPDGDYSELGIHFISNDVGISQCV